MMTLLRKHRQWLMIVIAILAVPFVFYFVQKPDYGSMHSDQVARIYGHGITNVEFQRNRRLFDLARGLGMTAFLQDLVAGARTQDEAYIDFTAHLAILQHEAEKFGIHPTTPEVANFVRTFEAFQENGAFDITKYNNIVQNNLPAQGFSEAELEELASDSIILDRIKTLVATGVDVPASQIKDEYTQAYGKLDVDVVRFHEADFASAATVTDADVSKFYDTHKTELQTEPKRKVDLVTFALTDQQKKLTGKERIDVLQKLADRANDFTQALLEKGADFQQAAAKFQAPIKTTGEFTESAPDSLLKADPQLSQAAFKLTAQEPNSDAVQSSDGFYVLHLAGLTPARPLTIEEAKPKILEALKKEKVSELMTKKSADAVQLIRAKLKTGVPVDGAIAQAGFKPEKVTPFSLMEERDLSAPLKKEESTTPDLNSIRQATDELSPREVSDFTRTADGGLIAVLEKREPLDEAKFAQARGSLEERYQKSVERIAFYEWLRNRRQESGFQSATTG